MRISPGSATALSGLVIQDGLVPSLKATVLDLSNSNPLTAAIVDASGSQITSFGGGTQYADGAVRGTATGTIAMGDDGTNIQSLKVDSDGNLQVDVLSISGVTSTEYTEDAAAAANPIGGVNILVRTDTPATQTTTDGDNIAQRGTNYGAGFVQVLTSAGAFVDTFGGGTQYADGAARGTATGTIAMGDDGTNIQSIHVDTSGDLQIDVLTMPSVTVTGTFWQATQPVSIAAAVAVTNAGITTIAGAVAGTEMQVDVLTMPTVTVNSHAVTNAGTFATQATLQAGTAGIGKLTANSGVDIGDVDVTSVIPGTGATNLGKAIDTATGATDTGVLALTTRDDALTTLTPVDGDNVGLRTGAYGDLWVSLATKLDSTNDSVTATLSAETTKVIGTVNIAAAQTLATVTAVTAITNALPAGSALIGKVGIDQTTPGTTNAVSAVLTTGSAAIGKLAANSGVDIGDVDVTSIAAGANLIGNVDVAPRTTGGWSVGNFTSGDTYTALTATAQVIKAGAGKFGGYYVYNPNATATYVEIYNIAAASVTVGTSTAKLVFCIPATSGANLELLAGIPFDTAMSIAATTTGGGNTAPTTALEAMIFFV